MSDEYFLGSSEWAATRLRLQHELTKTNFDGHLLDPSIPPLEPGATIADVACGTGIWLLDVVDTVPDVEADGLDIDLSNVPPKGWLADGVSFRKHNILEDLAEEYLGRYDVINVQFASNFVRDSHIKQVMATLIKMLKPGGHLQNTDPDYFDWNWVTADGDRSPPEMTKFHHLFEDIFGVFRNQWRWLHSIEQTFKDAGLEEVVSRRP